MRYQKVKELSGETLLLQATATGKTVSADQVAVKANIKEAYRLELHNEIRKLAAEEAGVQTPGLIQYQGLEKVEEHFYLVRKNEKDHYGLEPCQPVSLTGVIPVLLQLAQIMDAYHRQGAVLGGLSPGLLQLNRTGEVLLQDPPVINHLAKLLEGNYEYSLPVEVIKGEPWGVKADIFSWGELAYRLLTGEAPFAAALPEDRVAKVIAGMVIDPRNLQPKVSAALSRLILTCLAIEPGRRPATAVELLRQLEALIGEQNCLASDEEVAQFEEKALLNRKRQQSRERFRLWWRKYGLTWCGISGAVLILLLTILAPRKTILTSRTSPDQVVDYYFKAIRTVDVSLLDETIHRTKNDLSEIVSNIHVINASRKANELKLSEDAIKIQIAALKIKKERATAETVVYLVKYQIHFVTANEIQYLTREDRFTLTPVRRVWRITQINKLREQRRTKKIAPSPSALPLKGD